MSYKKPYKGSQASKPPGSSMGSMVSEANKAVFRAEQTLFAKIYPAMVEANGVDKNLMFSPFNLCSILVMLHAGADGETAQEVQDVLELPEDASILYIGFEDIRAAFKDNNAVGPGRRRMSKSWSKCGKCFGKSQKSQVSRGDFTLETANQIFVQRGHDFTHVFMEILKNTFETSVKSLDFTKGEEPLLAINKWVATETHEKITELMPSGSLDASTTMIVASSIYFKGKWESPFKKSETKEAEFYVSSSETVKCCMMAQTRWFAFKKLDALGCTVLQLPYKGERLDMLLFLSDTAEGFDLMEKELATFDVKGLKLGIKATHEVKVSLPKFTLWTKHSLAERFKGLGIVKMFDESADFSTMFKSKALHVSEIFQLMFIVVNEEGTEAATAITANTALSYGIGQPGEQPVHLTFNRPFLFVIKDSGSGVILFNGRVVNPASMSPCNVTE